MVNVDVHPGEFIRRRGCDLAEGQKILGGGRTDSHDDDLLFLASQGFADVTVGGQVNAAIVSTGDEVVTPGSKLRSGANLRQQFGIASGSGCNDCGASVKSAQNIAPTTAND